MKIFLGQESFQKGLTSEHRQILTKLKKFSEVSKDFIIQKKKNLSNSNEKNLL